MARERAIRLKYTPLVLILAFAAGGCDQLIRALTGPHAAPNETWQKNVPAWSPYVVIHANDGALEGYREALATLASNGAVRGARIGLYADGRSASTVNLAVSFGLEVVGIVDNSDLFRPDLEQAFDQYRLAYSQVRIFQIGNEITTSTPSMSANAYVDVISRVYAHVTSQYPDVTLVSEATFGSGNIGAENLTVLLPAFHARGFLPTRLIVGVNCYSETALASYAAILPTLPGEYRIWVTETGIPNQAGHLDYVNQTYPRLTTLLGAERVYWYALWAGDSGGDSGYSLIKSPGSPPIVPGALFQKLTEGA